MVASKITLSHRIQIQDASILRRRFAKQLAGLREGRPVCQVSPARTAGCLLSFLKWFRLQFALEELPSSEPVIVRSLVPPSDGRRRRWQLRTLLPLLVRLEACYCCCVCGECAFRWQTIGLPGNSSSHWNSSSVCVICQIARISFLITPTVASIAPAFSFFAFFESNHGFTEGC